MKRYFISFLFIFAVLLGLFFAPNANALSPGDIFVADPSAPGSNGGIFKINPFTGESQVVSSNGSFTEPTGIAIDANGDLLVGDPQAFSGGGAVFRINPTTGDQTMVSSGGSFVDPRGVVVASNGDLYVADSDAFNFYGGVIKVDPITGAQTTVYVSSDQNAGPLHLAIEANGNILISDVSAFGGSGGVIRLDPATGISTTVSSGGNFNVPVGITVVGNGDIYVANNSGSILKVDPITGAQTVAATGWPLVCPTGIAFDSSGNLLVSDPCQEPGAVIKINLVTGAKTILASFGSSPQGIAVVPSPTACVLPPSEMVSWWPGDGNANDIIDGNPGTLQNGTAFAAGKVGFSFSLDGVNDNVLIGNPTNLRLQDFTIDAWIKLNTLTIDGFTERIAGYSIGGYGFFLAGPVVVNANGATAVRQLSLDKAGFDMVAAPLSVNDLEWHHAAVTKSGGTVTFYLDGVQGAAQRGGSPVTSYNPGFVFNTSFMLGNLDGQDQPFPGLLDEVEVFNRALTSTEIQSLYTAGSFGKCKSIPTPTPTPTPTPPSSINLNIDIKPGSLLNPVNIKSKGRIPVAIVSSAGFYAPVRVNKTSLLFGRVGNETSLSSCNSVGEDVNYDGFLDLVCHFNTQQTGFQSGNTKGKLNGKTIDGVDLTGDDAIQTL